MTTPLRVLLVDDEELSRLRLRTLLADCVDPAAQVVGEGRPRRGHGMALRNVRERLMLLHDLGVRFEAGAIDGGRFRVRIAIALPD